MAMDKTNGKYSVEEENLLLLLTLKEKHHLDSENGGSARRRESTWEKISKEYNALTKGESKDSRSLRAKYASMKREIIKDTVSKKSETAKTTEKPKEAESVQMLVEDEDTMPVLESPLISSNDKRDFSNQIKASVSSVISTTQNESCINGKEIEQPSTDKTVDLNLECFPIEKLPPQKIPVYDSRVISSKLDEIVRNVMREDALEKGAEIDIRTGQCQEKKSTSSKQKRLRKSTLEDGTEIGVQNRPCQDKVTTSSKQKRVCENALEEDTEIGVQNRPCQEKDSTSNKHEQVCENASEDIVVQNRPSQEKDSTSNKHKRVRKNASEKGIKKRPGQGKDSVLNKKKQVRKNKLGKGTTIGTRNRPCNADDLILIRQKIIFKKRLEILEMQRLAVKQIMRHKLREHQLIIEQMEMEHQLRAEYFVLSIPRRRVNLR